MSRVTDDMFELEGYEEVRRTDDAILYESPAGDEFWFPKSKIEESRDGTMLIPMWLAEKKEMV